MKQTRPTIVGLSGKLKSGKTTVAKRLCRRFGFAPISFASALKADLEDLGIQAAYLYDTKPPIIRQLMQVYGQAQRFQDPGHWVNRAMTYVERMQRMSPGTVIVVDDVRFPNEVDAIHARGGIVLRLARSNPVICTGYDDESETSLDDSKLDGYITVDEGDLDLLEALVVRELQQHGVF